MNSKDRLTRNACFFFFAAILSGSLFFVWGNKGRSDEHFYSLERGRTISFSEAIEDLGKKRVILVGEHHTQNEHHQIQLMIIRALRETGIPLAIGVEMFRADSQNALDRWNKGEMTEQELQQIYFENWNYPWVLYRPIFRYAKDLRIPLVGLNVPREISLQVARQGFKSLSEDQKGRLFNVTCRVDAEYMDYIRRAYGTHAHGEMNFTYFCEAQLVWDKAMALRAVDYLKAHPDTLLVLLVGTGHARKGAIPRQIQQYAQFPYSVILPYVPEVIEPDIVTPQDADFIFSYY